jgi:hypothetical protein
VNSVRLLRATHRPHHGETVTDEVKRALYRAELSDLTHNVNGESEQLRGMDKQMERL